MDAGSNMVCSYFEDSSLQMKKVLEKHNVYHSYMVNIQNVESYSTYRDVKVDYNAWDSEDETGGVNELHFGQ